MASRSLTKKPRPKNIRSIAIIGLGQIGGSFALAIRKKKLPFRVLGIDTSKKRLRLMKGKLHETSTHWEKANEADLILVCLHYRSTINFLKQASRNPLIVDVCSSKQQVVLEANRKKLRFIGGHPMAGNEREAEKGWDPDLFRDAPFFLCPGKFVFKDDQNIISRLVRKIGAVPIRVNPEAHDKSVAFTSHFPAFLSKMLAECSRSLPLRFQGPGFKSMTRLSRTSPQLLHTFLQSNRANILSAAKDLRSQLDVWIKSLQTK